MKPIDHGIINGADASHKWTWLTPHAWWVHLWRAFLFLALVRAAENTSALGGERQHLQHRARQDNERVSYALEISYFQLYLLQRTTVKISKRKLKVAYSMWGLRAFFSKRRQSPFRIVTKRHSMWAEILTDGFSDIRCRQLGEKTMLQSIDKAGHLVHLERPCVYNQHLKEFLAYVTADCWSFRRVTSL